MAADEMTPQPRVPETRRDQAAAQETTTKSADLGLALSGGGIRAALFSLGVIIGLIETGCHRRVRCVASVSGGSILNAALARAKPSLHRLSSVAEFEPEASKLATRLASRGVFAFDWRSVLGGVAYAFRVIISALPLLAGVLAGLAAGLADSLSPEFKGAVTNFDLARLPWVTIVLVLLASLLLSVVFNRGYFQELQYASALGSGLSLDVKDWSKDHPGVMHVLVATDLLSGEPIYFSGQFVYCRPYGWSTPEDITTAEALYSSAAFPGVFPPKRLRTGRLRFQNGDMPGPLPRYLRLADGGVYNNLGNDWFDVLIQQSREASPAPLWPFGELGIERLRIEKENVIIVNAGAPSARVDGLWPGPFTLARIMSVLYDNTVRPRIELVQQKKDPLIDIRETPLKLAETLKDQGGAVGERASDLITMLKGKTDEFWADFSRDTAGTETKLSSAGPRQAARLMLHGYLSSLVLFYAKFGGQRPQDIQGEAYFLKLVSRQQPAREMAKRTRPTVKGIADAPPEPTE